MTISDKAKHTSLTNAAAFILKTAPAGYTGEQPPGPLEEAASAWDYTFSSGCALRTRNSEDTTFCTHSFTVDVGELAIANNGKSGAVVTFPHEGLILKSGSIGNYYQNGAFIDGKVTVSAAASAPYIIFASQKGTSTVTDLASLVFRGDWFGSGALVLSRNYKNNYSFGDATNAIFTLSGEMTEFTGSITLWVYNNDLSDMAFQHNRRTTLRRTTDTTFNGSLTLMLNTGIDLASADVDFTVKNLSFGRNNEVRYVLDTDVGKASSLTVVESLTLTAGAPVTLVVYAKGAVPTSKTSYPILTAPAGVTLSPDSFLFRSVGAALTFMIKPDPETGLSTVYAVSSPQIKLENNDSSKGPESFSKGKAYGEKEGKDWNNWVGGAWPTEGYSYLVEGKKLRAPESAPTGSTANPGAFLGDTLTLRNGATLEFCPTNVEVPMLYAEALTGNVVIKFVRPRTCTLAGTWQMRSAGEKWVRFELSQSRTFWHKEDLVGDGNVCFMAGCETSANPPKGTHRFEKTNPHFSGSLSFCYMTNATWKTSKEATTGVAVPNMDHCCHIQFTDPGAFGRSVQAVTNNLAVRMEDYTIIEPLNDVTLDDPCRGWSIQNYVSGGAGVARFRVPKNVTMTFRERLDFNASNATLFKEGKGCLALGGFTPTFWGANRDPTATSSNNMFRVMGGSVRVLTGHVFEGLQVFFGPGTELVLDAATTDATLSQYGVWNNVYRSGREDRSGDDKYWGKPLSLVEGAETLNVKVIDSQANVVAPNPLPLFTVGEEYADALAKLIRLTHPYEGAWARVDCSDSFDAPMFGGLLKTVRVTFLRGLSVIIR